MKKLTKRVISMAAVLAMCFSLAACGEKAEDITDEDIVVTTMTAQSISSEEYPSIKEQG